MIDPVLADRLRATLQEVSGVVSAYVFGSVASGREHRDSDLDIAVRLDRSTFPTSAERFAARLDLLSSLQHAAGWNIDLVILNDAPPTLARDIMTRGTRLLALDPEAEHACLRLALSRSADLV